MLKNPRFEMKPFSSNTGYGLVMPVEFCEQYGEKVLKKMREEADHKHSWEFDYFWNLYIDIWRCKCGKRGIHDSRVGEAIREAESGEARGTEQNPKDPVK